MLIVILIKKKITIVCFYRVKSLLKNWSLVKLKEQLSQIFAHFLKVLYNFVPHEEMQPLLA